MRARPSLFRHAVRSHLAGALACGIGGGVAMFITALSLEREFDQFPGGAAALGTMVASAAEAMRVVRWPAERLDTLGGYLTYHNVLLVPLLLGIYAAVQGAQALRGAEEKRLLDLWLATGYARWRVVLDRAAAFGLALAIVAIGIGAGTAAGMSLGGDAQAVPSLVVAAECSLAAAVFYGLALLLSSIFATSGAAAGATVLVMVGLYFATNVWELIGPFGAIRFASPFWLRQRSDLLIPGRELDLVATIALAAMALALAAVGGALFVRRDYARTLVALGMRSRSRRTRGGLAWRPNVAIASLFEQRLAILAWMIGAGVFMAIFASLLPRIEDLWTQLDFARLLLAPTADVDLITQLVGMSAEILGPTLAAFAVVQSARWVRERSDGRDEVVVAQPISRSRWVLERIGALALGGLAVIVAAVAGLAMGAAAGSVRLDGLGLIRLSADLLLLTVSVGAISLAVVALLRGGVAVALLTAWIVAAYLLVLFAPAFDWPAWAVRLSIFDAFGEPYATAPDGYGIAMLAAAAVAGVATTIAVLERRRAV